MKRWNVFFILLVVCVSVSFNYKEAKTIKLKKVVIDAGHGGDDPGAVGKKSKEKDIALSIALKLGNCIKENLPEVQVIFTRSTDKFVELYKRARIANENKADLFISIHCNSTVKPESSGTETWVMGLHKSQANLEVAKKENSTILLENDYSQQYDGFDPNSPEANIIFSLYQNIYLDHSLTLATKVQNQFTIKAGRVSRGVKQAGFLVLFKTTMPGALIETGFISNPAEEEYLISEKGQNQIASSIFRAIRDYKNELEGNGSKASIDDSENNDNLVIKTSDTIPMKNINNDVVIKDTSKIINKTKEIFFRVQIVTSDKKKSLDSPVFKGAKNIRYYVQNGVYKYTAGNEKTMEGAVKIQNEMQKLGFKDAFVVAFLNEERISPQEAVKLLKN
jgi:N-acetylmuramoyl-L-alanine amidase